MLDGLRSLDGAARSQRRRARELGQIAETLSQLHQRTVNLDEAAQLLGTPGPNAPGPAPKTLSWEELPGQVPTVRGSEERTEIELLINDHTLLNVSERATLFLSYFADYTLAEIGDLLGVTESRACQVRKAALTKLRHALERGEPQSTPT